MKKLFTTKNALVSNHTVEAIKVLNQISAVITLTYTVIVIALLLLIAIINK